MADPFAKRSPELKHAEAQAAAVIGVWLLHDPGEPLAEAINTVLDEDGGISPLISGLVNLSAYLLSMLSISLGTTSEALVGGFVSSKQPSFDQKAAQNDQR